MLDHNHNHNHHLKKVCREYKSAEVKILWCKLTIF